MQFLQSYYVKTPTKRIIIQIGNIYINALSMKNKKHFQYSNLIAKTVQKSYNFF